MKFSNLKFRQKFILSYGIVIIGFIMSSLWTIYGLQDLIKSADNNIQGKDLRESLKQIYIDHLQWSKTVNMFFIEENSGTINVQTNDHQCNFGKILYSDQRDKITAVMPELEPLFKSVEKPHYHLHNSIAEINQILKTAPDSVRMVAAKKIYLDQTEADLKTVVDYIEQIISKSEQISISDEIIHAKQQAISVQLIIFTFVSALVAVFFAIVITINVTNSVQKGIQFAQQVSQGNLTVEANINQTDEIGQLVKHVQNMVHKIKEVITEVVRGADNIAMATSQISETSQDLSQGANEQASSTEEASSSMEEMSANIEHNTSNALETNKIAVNTRRQVEAGKQAIEQTMKSMRTIAEKVGIVSEIAYQTNILALNAAVEAARAGDHGKGFAVVAAEVRKLAERSLNAAKEIDALTASSVDISENAGKLFMEIVPAIQKTAELVEEITMASKEQESGVNQVNTAIQQLNTISQRNAAASEELATNSEEMNSQAEQLKSVINFFKL